METENGRCSQSPLQSAKESMCTETCISLTSIYLCCTTPVSEQLLLHVLWQTCPSGTDGNPRHVLDHWDLLATRSAHAYIVC